MVYCPDLLSVREGEVLLLFLREQTSKEIADRLDLSAKTVSHHKKKAMRKLRVGSDVGLVKLALREDLELQLDRFVVSKQ